MTERQKAPNSPPATGQTMKRRTLSLAGLSAMAFVTALMMAGHDARASDHADSPDTSEGNLDINDLYVFNQGDNVVFALTVSPLLTPGEATDNASLNPMGLYQIKLDAERDGIEEAVIQIAASGTGANQVVSVRGPVTPSSPGVAGNVLEDAPAVRGAFDSQFGNGDMTVFAGPRDDPFFVDLFGDMSVTSVLNAAYSAALGEMVGDSTEQTLAFNPEAQDDLAGLNVLAVVIELPKSAVAQALGISESDTFFSWATTSIRN